ncbi:hypothetical protein VTK73DRAFT_4383 [Phialemonium thermophilum]|uniref:Ribosomal protein S17 n=1 Tax=Phialemonium thermophilum TaxID=223376 RepID=A0ABR3XZD2_9PEZI
MASTFLNTARQTFRELHGVVVSAGLMQRTVKVRVGGQKWNGKVKKFFKDPQTFLVHDPNDSLRTGDIVAITPGWRTSKNKRHVVKRVIAPSGTPIDERPPIPSEDERWEAKIAKKKAKDERRFTNRPREPLPRRSTGGRAKVVSDIETTTSISDVD